MLTRHCPNCNRPISGWLLRLFEQPPRPGPEDATHPGPRTIAWPPFKCASCGVELQLALADPLLLPKALGGGFAFAIGFSFVDAMTGLTRGCSFCDILVILAAFVLIAAFCTRNAVTVTRAPGTTGFQDRDAR